MGDKQPNELDANPNTNTTPPTRYKSRSKLYCSNCGRNGHPYKACNKPITSYGVVDILITTDDSRIAKGITDKLSIDVDAVGPGVRDRLSVDTNGIRYDTPNGIRTFCTYKDNIRFLLVRRKHTLGFLEFLRGRYNVENIDCLVFLFKQMTKEEISLIGRTNFDELWEQSWENSKRRSRYRNEYNDSKHKFEQLQGADTNSINNLEGNRDKILSLDFYVNNVTPNWTHAEWGFPKGRRNYRESDLMCALREFQEESGFTDGDYTVLDKLSPIKENLVGTNGINYLHVYYTSLSATNKVPTLSTSNMSQSNEIGDIGWFTYDEAMKVIRPYHTDRKKILTQLYMYFMNVVSEILDGLDQQQ